MPEHPTEGFALEELGNEIWAALVETDIVDGHQIRVIERRDGLVGIRFRIRGGGQGVGPTEQCYRHQAAQGTNRPR